MDLVNNCPSISNAEEYAKIIAEKYNVRRLITASREIIDDATAGNDDPSVLIDSAEQKILTSDRAMKSTVLSVSTR